MLAQPGITATGVPPSSTTTPSPSSSHRARSDAGSSWGRPAGAERGHVDQPGRGGVVGDPGGGDGAGAVVQVRGRRAAVILDGNAPAAVGALVVEQDGGLLQPGYPGGPPA